VCVPWCVCARALGGQTAGPFGTKLGIRIHLDSGSVLGKSRSTSEHHRRDNGGACLPRGTRAELMP